MDTWLCTICMFWEVMVHPPSLAACGQPYGLQQWHTQGCGDRGLLGIFHSPQIAPVVARLIV